MGLDDRCWDVGNDGLARKVLKILSRNQISSCYTFDKELSEERLDSYEETPMYNGYSLAWHMLYPVYHVYEAGMTIGPLDKRIPKLLARIAVLENLYRDSGNHFDRASKKQKKALQHHIAESKMNLDRIRLEREKVKEEYLKAQMDATFETAHRNEC